MAQPIKTALHREQARQIIERQWGRALSATERSVVFFVFDRTVGWGKPFEVVSASHMTDGTTTHSGLMISLKTAKVTLQELAERGVLLRRARALGFEYGINFDWRPDMPLAMPKKQRPERGLLAAPKVRDAAEPVSELHQDWCQDYTDLGVKITPPILKGKEQNTNSTPSVPSARMVLDEKIQQASQKNAAARDRVRTRPAPKPRVADVQAKLFDVWRSAWTEQFPDIPCIPWTRKVQGQAKHLAQAIEAAGSNPNEVLDWTIFNWGLIRNTTFSWMKDNPPPEQPTIGFLLSFRDKIVEAWGKKDRLQQELRLTTTQRNVQRLKREGMTHEQATEEAEAREERGNLRQRTAAVKVELAQLERARDRALTENVRAAGRAKQQRERGPMRNAYDEGGGIQALPSGGFEDE